MGIPFILQILHFQVACILEMEEENWILPGNIELPKTDRNTKILGDLGAVIYDIANFLENFGGMNDLKQLKENTTKRIEKLETLPMVSINKYQGNIQQAHIIFEPNKVDKLKEQIYALKTENETIKIRAIERQKVIGRPTATSSNGGKVGSL